MKKHAIVIGAGFAGLGIAALLGKEGWQVTLLEKNASAGGRARLWQQDGYSFDMGPSWYLMPEVFETFFQLCGEKREDYYSLTKLDPYYRIFWAKQEFTDIRADRNQIDAVFNQLEDGGARKLQSYLEQAEFKYRIALKQFLYREYRTIFDFFNSTIILKGLKLNIFKDLDRYVSTFFSNPRIKKILEYAMVFLGNSPDNAPALYSLLSHVDLNLGVWFPARGMIAIVKALEQLCRKSGVEIHYNREVKELVVENKLITRVLTAGQEYTAELVISSADLHHTETALLAAPYRSYPEKYWAGKVIAPSMFILFLGIKKTLPSILHHNLYFAPDWYQHFAQIFKKPAWPREPCYYVSCTSKTDKSVAPPPAARIFLSWCP